MQGNVNRTRRALARLVVMVMMVAATAVSLAPTAEAQSNPYERGPDPSDSLVEGSGPYSTSSTSVSSFVSGFGGGRIYYPTGTNDTFGGVALAPGFTASSTSYSWIGPRLASHGFVVFLIDTNSRFDFPSSRASQLDSALDYLTDSSDVSSRVDDDRLAVMGHSMGGGGSLHAAEDDSDLQAAIPLTPWTISNSFYSIDVPTLVLAAENDSVASVSSHASPQYNSIPSSTDKMFIEIDGAGHFVANTTNTTVSRYSVAWLKRFVDNDTRYDPYLCGQPHQDYIGGLFSPVSDDRDTCPYS